MEIYPERQFLLFALSFSWGAIGVVLLWLFAAFRATIGAYVPSTEWEALYKRKLPLLKRPPLRSTRQKHAVFSVGCTVLCDVAFCVVLATGEILLLYEYNDGEMRPFALLCALSGLALMHTLTSRISGAATAYIGYGMAAFRAYVVALLLLLWRFVLWAWKTLLLRPMRALWRYATAKHLAKTSAALCRAQLARAERGLAEKDLKKEGISNGRQKKIARA